MVEQKESNNLKNRNKMKKTTVTVVVEHYEESELNEALREVYDRIVVGYSQGAYEGDNELSVEFKVEVTEA